MLIILTATVGIACLVGYIVCTERAVKEESRKAKPKPYTYKVRAEPLQDLGVDQGDYRIIRQYTDVGGLKYSAEFYNADGWQILTWARTARMFPCSDNDEPYVSYHDRDGFLDEGSMLSVYYTQALFDTPSAAEKAVCKEYNSWRRHNDYTIGARSWAERNLARSVATRGACDCE